MLPPDHDSTLEERVIAGLRSIFDPEIPLNIYDLGLIYDIIINENNDVDIKMTLTSPGCPVAQTFPGTVEQEIRQVEGVNEVRVELVWDPPWTPDVMDEDARLQMGMFNY